MNRLNILQLGSPTGLFGAERWILALIKYLDKSKFNIHVAAIKDHPCLEVPLCREAKSLGFSTKIFEAYGRFNFSAVKQVKKFILENNIHIIHTHAYKQDIIGILASISTRCKTITTPHGWSKKADFKLMVYETINKLIFPFFDAVVPLSEELYKSCLKIPFLREKLHLIKNGVDIEEVKNTKDIAQEILKLKENKVLIIGYIGQLIPRKGLDILLSALKDLREIDWHLFIIGEGKEKNRLISMSKEFGIDSKIHFTGFREDRLSFLKGFDIFVLPSRLEGIPRCLMEAGGMGIPIIASRIPGCMDIVINNKTGLLFTPEDPLSLKNAILKLGYDDDFRKQLGQNASLFIEKKYSAKKMAKEYEELYFNLLSK
ncbi:glycosyltransferase family 4 protein [Desulfothermus naphthae]